jgi:hypothetical protein
MTALQRKQVGNRKAAQKPMSLSIQVVAIPDNAPKLTHLI